MKYILKKLCIGLLFCGLIIPVEAQEKTIIQHVEPPFWWTGMSNHDLQLLIHGEKVSRYKVTINHSGVAVQSVTTLESPNYLFVNLKITDEAKAGQFSIELTDGNKKLTYNYELKPREQRTNIGQAINPSDVIYLITPDRFANGDTTNDSTDDTIEKANRKDDHGRHGGDIKGIINHFDYIKELGITTLWLNPFLENDQPAYSYHGYGISDFYKTDSRYGSNNDFKTLVDLSHENGMKVIMDQVFNHCGSGHWWMDDLPSKDWLSQWDTFTRSNFDNIATSDPHVSQSDFDLLTKGWFDTNLPDLNLENPFLETYLIQNSIWWIEYSGIDGIRMDTYPYPNKHAMARWMQRLNQEYPDYFMVAETWTKRASYLSYWNRNTVNKDGYTSYVNSISDYPLYFAIINTFKKDGKISELYETLAEDFVYGNPNNNKVFNGNHDVDRLFALLGENKEKLKLSMAFTLTTRGIPQLYYGDEILMKNKKPDGKIREDFPGGWKGDSRNAFIKKGRTADENEVFNYIKTILDWRKNAEEIHKGKLTHYQPYNNVYVYFRYTENNKTMIIINNSDEQFEQFNLSRFNESLVGYNKGVDILTGNQYNSLKTLNLKPNTALIVELDK